MPKGESIAEVEGPPGLEFSTVHPFTVPTATGVASFGDKYVSSSICYIQMVIL